jgi:hypothetical protein
MGMCRPALAAEQFESMAAGPRMDADQAVTGLQEGWQRLPAAEARVCECAKNRAYESEIELLLYFSVNLLS